MIKQNKHSLPDKDFCIDSTCMNSQDNLLTPLHPDSYKIGPPQNSLEYKEIYNLVDEAENVCRECGEYHSFQGRVLRPSSEALNAWIEMKKNEKSEGGKNECLKTKNLDFLVL